MTKELERRRDAFDDLGELLTHTLLEEGEDLTPTWAGLMPALMEILENGSPKGKAGVRSELMRLAEYADRVITGEMRPAKIEDVLDNPKGEK